MTRHEFSPWSVVVAAAWLVTGAAMVAFLVGRYAYGWGFDHPVWWVPVVGIMVMLLAATLAGEP